MKPDTSRVNKTGHLDLLTTPNVPHSTLGYRTPNEFVAVLKSSVMTG